MPGGPMPAHMQLQLHHSAQTCSEAQHGPNSCMCGPLEHWQCWHLSIYARWKGVWLHPLAHESKQRTPMQHGLPTPTHQ